MRRSVFFALMMGIFAAPLEAAPAIPLNLEEALALALRDNKDVLLGVADVRKARAKIAEARADFLPTVSFNGNWNYTIGEYASDFAVTGTQFTFKQYLYKGGKAINTFKQSQNGLVVAQAVLDKTKLDIVSDVRKAFYSLLLARDYARLNRRIARNTEEHLALLKERFKSGQASTSDLLDIKTALKNVFREYVASLNQVEALQALMKNLLALDPAVRIAPEGALTYDIEDVVYDVILAKTLAQRPEIKQAEAQIKFQKNAVEIAKAAGRPQIYAAWDYYSSSHQAIQGLVLPRKGWTDSMDAGLVFSWPIFDGFLTKAKVDQAIVDLKQAQLLKEKAIQDIHLELKNAYLSFKDSLAMIDASAADAARYKDRLGTAQEKYRKGILSILDLSDVRLQYIISEFNKYQALYDYWVARTSLDRAKGELNV